MSERRGRKPKNPDQLRIDGTAEPVVELEPKRRNFVLPHSVPLIVDTGRLAGVLGVGERTCQKWRNEGMPRHAHGKWNLADVIPWVLERIANRSKPDDGTAEEALTRYQRARASLHEIELAREQRRVISLDEHLAIVDELAQVARGVLDAAPMRYFDEREDQDRARIICDAVALALAHAGRAQARDVRRMAADPHPAPAPK